MRGLVKPSEPESPPVVSTFPSPSELANSSLTSEFVEEPSSSGVDVDLGKKILTKTFYLG